MGEKIKEVEIGMNLPVLPQQSGAFPKDHAKLQFELPILCRLAWFKQLQ